MNKKAQGLPLNFIVLAAIAILILILVVGFVIGGGISFGGAVSPAQFSANCKSICSEYQRDAKQVNFVSDSTAGKVSAGFSTLLKTDPYCVEQDIQGGTGQSCADIETCYVIFGNNIQKQLRCQGGISGGGSIGGGGSFNPLT